MKTRSRVLWEGGKKNGRQGKKDKKTENEGRVQNRKGSRR